MIASATGTVEVPELQAGDTARVVDEGGTVRGSATYDGTPAILGDACIGSTSFRATRSAPGFEFDAGAGVLSDDDYGMGIDSTISDSSPAVVKLSRPLAAGDVVFVGSSKLAEELAVSTARSSRPRTARRPRHRSPGRIADEPGRAEGRPTARAASVTAAASLLKRLGLAACGRSRTLALPVAFSGPGPPPQAARAWQRSSAGHQERHGAGDRRVTVTLTPAGRKLLKRATRLKLTLTGTFTPSRAGEVPERASVSVTLRR